MSEQEFNQALAYIKKIDPDNGWIPDLDKGFSAVRSMYMKKALEELKVREVFEQKPDTEKPAELTESEIQQIRRSIVKMYTERAILSNSFHACTTDKERARVCDHLDVVQNKIKAAHLKIEYYEENGALPADPAPDLPKDPYDLHRKIRSWATQISRLNKRLDKAHTTDEKDFIKHQIKVYATKQEIARRKIEEVRGV